MRETEIEKNQEIKDWKENIEQLKNNTKQTMQQTNTIQLLKNEPNTNGIGRKK